MISERAKEAFLHLCMHAKIHEKLDSIPWYQEEIDRIDKAKIRAYDNNDEYTQLEATKRELLAIRFIDQKDLEGIRFV